MGNGSVLFSKGVMVLELQKHMKMVPSGIPDCSKTTLCATVYAIYIFNMPFLGPTVHLCVYALVSIQYNTQHNTTQVTQPRHPCHKGHRGITEGEAGLFSL